MPKHLVKKSLNRSIDELLISKGIDLDIKLFGNPLQDFEFNELSCSELENLRRLLNNKIKQYEI